jgi:hypothetical protein
MYGCPYLTHFLVGDSDAITANPLSGDYFFESRPKDLSLPGRLLEPMFRESRARSSTSRALTPEKIKSSTRACVVAFFYLLAASW